MNCLPKEILAFLPIQGECQTRRPLIMGILNITPDSFSDGGHYLSLSNAVARAKQMVAEGVDIIDIGGESARPGADAIVNAEEELKRIIPVIKALKNEIATPISVDTYKPEVMQAAIEAGANMINDIYALQKPGALEVISKYKVPVCLMHMKGEPSTMQQKPEYENVIDEINDFFAERIKACENAGIDKNRLIVDPGFGFGKTTEHNAILTQQLHQFSTFGLPILFGASRKASIGAILNKPASERLYGSIAVAVMAAIKGAAIIRVHDVSETVDALKVSNVILSATL